MYRYDLLGHILVWSRIVFERELSQVYSYYLVDYQTSTSPPERVTGYLPHILTPGLHALPDPDYLW